MRYSPEPNFATAIAGEMQGMCVVDACGLRISRRWSSWFSAPCNRWMSPRFEGTYCLYLQGDQFWSCGCWSGWEERNVSATWEGWTQSGHQSSGKGTQPRGASSKNDPSLVPRWDMCKLTNLGMWSPISYGMNKTVSSLETVCFFFLF